MKLKDDIDILAFLDAAKTCSGEVFFHSAQNDILNLKSLISQYVLVSIYRKPDLLEDARIVCTNEEDYARLTDFLS